jgi:hypothetical protein
VIAVPSLRVIVYAFFTISVADCRRNVSPNMRKEELTSKSWRLIGRGREGTILEMT